MLATTHGLTAYIAMSKAPTVDWHQGMVAEGGWPGICPGLRVEAIGTRNKLDIILSKNRHHSIFVSRTSTAVTF
jgi:hypothetical protein